MKLKKLILTKPKLQSSKRGVRKVNGDSLVKARVSSYRNDTWYIRLEDSTEYQIDSECLLFSKEPHVKKIYSLPTNDKYNSTVLRELNYSKQLPDAAVKAWSKVKVGMLVKGEIKDNKFIIIRI